MKIKLVELQSRTVDRLKIYIDDFDMTIDDAINKLIDLNTKSLVFQKKAESKKVHNFENYSIFFNDKKGIEVSENGFPVSIKKDSLIHIGRKIGLDPALLDRDRTTYQIGYAVIKELKKL
jgi:hypothetical protein